MGVILDVMQACEQRLESLLPTTPIFFVGVAGQAPEELYIRCSFSIQNPEDPVLTAGYHREIIDFQVFVLSRKDEGAGEAYQYAELIRNSFYKSLTILKNTTQIHILNTASIGTAIPTTDRLVVPVIIRLVAEVYS